MASGIEKMIEAKIKGFLQDTLGITPEAILEKIAEMQRGVQYLFASSARQERKLDAILRRAGFSEDQIAELNNGPGNGSGAGSPAIEHQRIDG